MRLIMSNLDFIEHPRATEILIELSKFSREIFFGELSEKIQCSNTTILARLTELKRAGIVVDRYEKVRSRDNRIREKRFIKFTKKGKVVGDILRELDCRLV